MIGHQMLDACTSTRTELHFIKDDKRTGLFICRQARSEFSFEIDLQIKEERIKVVQIEIEEFYHQRIHCTKIHKDIRVILVAGKLFNNIAFANAPGALNQEGHITLSLLLPSE
ncbi:hypothetical protein SDC9_160494 [bioreactor metagenome]|uniref:Uncharacterized protein n=1 Tax=bioreactor metagenome TaxID=1076179 RepID=A0A645FL87_9ZZZZ